MKNLFVFLLFLPFVFAISSYDVPNVIQNLNLISGNIHFDNSFYVYCPTKYWYAIDNYNSYVVIDDEKPNNLVSKTTFNKVISTVLFYNNLKIVPVSYNLPDYKNYIYYFEDLNQNNLANNLSNYSKIFLKLTVQLDSLANYLQQEKSCSNREKIYSIAKDLNKQINTLNNLKQRLYNDLDVFLRQNPNEKLVIANLKNNLNINFSKLQYNIENISNSYHVNSADINSLATKWLRKKNYAIFVKDFTEFDKELYKKYGYKNCKELVDFFVIQDSAFQIKYREITLALEKNNLSLAKAKMKYLCELAKKKLKEKPINNKDENKNENELYYYLIGLLFLLFLPKIIMFIKTIFIKNNTEDETND